MEEEENARLLNELIRKDVAAEVIGKTDLSGWDRSSIISFMEDTYFFIKNGKRVEVGKKGQDI